MRTGFLPLISNTFYGTFRTPIDLKNCTIQIADGNAGTNQNSITLRIGNGNFTWSEKHNIEYIKDRGKLDTVRKGEQEPVEVRFEATYILLTQDSGNADEPISVEDALKKRSGASGWKSTSSDDCEPFAVNLIFTYDPVCPNVKNEVVTFPDFRYETLEHDPKAGTIQCTGKSNVIEPTVSRVVDSTPETDVGV